MRKTSAAPVVVGVDGSEPSLHAVRWGAEQADRHGVPLHLVHGYEIPAGYRPGVADRRTVRAAMKAQGRNWLAQARDAAERAVPGLAVVDSIQETVPAVATLINQSHRAAQVAIGTRGVGGFAGQAVGSTGMDLTARSMCPVVVVRGRYPDEPPPTDGPVVLGVDSTPANPALITFALGEASVRGTDLVVVHAWPELLLEIAFAGNAAALNFARMAQQAEKDMVEDLNAWRERYPNVTVIHKVMRERPAAALLRHTDRAQLVVVGNRGRGGFRGLLLGSTSQQLLYHAKCPVAVVPTNPVH